MPRLVLFGPGYVGARIATALRGDDAWQVETFGRNADWTTMRRALTQATHLISTVPPVEEHDPILDAYGTALGRLSWIGYLSSTGVYGDTGGAWVDETAALAGRRGARTAADLAWQAHGACVLRLPGIYGPGRSVLDRLRDGRAHRADMAGQVFSRVHVDDIVAAVLLAIERGATGLFNLADDLPAPQSDVVLHGSRLLGVAPPPLLPLEQLGLSPEARAFYAENRRVANGKAKRLLGWRPRFPTYRDGLAAINPLSPSGERAGERGLSTRPSFASDSPSPNPLP